MKLGPLQKQWIRELPKFPKSVGWLAVSKPATWKKENCITGFCCLGVAAHLFAKAEWKESPKLYYSADQMHLQYGNNDIMLGRALTDQLRLRTSSGVLAKPVEVEGKIINSLAALNDCFPSKDHSFTAKFIKEHADLVFKGPA